MLIKSLRLRNIRSYQDQTLTFPAGSVLLSGDIGSGKSSILLAIEFALFGNDLDRLSTNALLRKGETEGFAELNFILNGQEIIVRRTLKKSKNTIGQAAGYIIINGVKKDLMPVEIKTQIIEMLGYPLELASKKKNYVFRYTVYCPQEEMKEILSDDEEGRLDTLRKIFNIDKYKTIRENCALYIKELKNKRNELEIKTENLEDLKKQLWEKQEKLDQNSLKLNELNPKIDGAEQEIIQIKNKISDVEKKLKELNELKKQLEVFSAQERLKLEQKKKNHDKIEKIKKQLTAVPVEISLEELKKQIDDEEKDISAFIEKNTVLAEKYNAIKNRIRELALEIDLNQQKISQLPGKKLKLNELQNKIGDLPALKNKQKELENSLEKINLVLREYEVNKQNSLELKNKILTLAKCPTCQQVVSKEHKEGINKEETQKILLYEKRMADCFNQKIQTQPQLENLKKNIEQGFELEKEFERLKTEVGNLEELKNAWQQKNIELNNKQVEEIMLRKDLEEVKKTDFDEKQARLKQNKELLEKIKEQKRLQSDLKELEEAINETDKELYDLTVQKTDLKLKIGLQEKAEIEYGEIKKQLESKQEQKNELMMEKIKLNTEISNFKVMVESLNSEIEAKNLIKTRLNKIKELTNWLNEHFMNLMTTIEKHVMARIQREFNELFKEWFSMLIEDENISAKLDDRFNPMIEQNGYEVDVNHLSGGERTSVALAYRLALNKVVNDVVSTIKTKDLLILDEPTDGFSSEQLDKVRDVLEQLGVKQTIIVSHENKIESFVEKVIRIQKREGISEVV